MAFPRGYEPFDSWNRKKRSHSISVKVCGHEKGRAKRETGLARRAAVVETLVYSTAARLSSYATVETWKNLNLRSKHYV